MLYVRAHYRSPIEYSEALLGEAKESLDRLDRFQERVVPGKPDQQAISRFIDVMDDDFGTSQAVSLMFDLIRDGNRLLDEGGDAAAVAGAVDTIVGVLGLNDAQDAPVDADAISDQEVEGLLAQRDQARSDRDFARADEIREQLANAGVTIEDGQDGTRWLRR
jgi:cysteinyl-tRNA synthetase